MVHESSVSVPICDLCVRWLCDACFRFLLARIASYFRVSVAVPVTCPMRCPDIIHRIKNRAVRLVPRVKDFLEKSTLRDIPTFSSLGNEERVAADGQAGRAGSDE